ncbi:MAG: CARDB domain-containing protein [Bacteroidota bacterium]
MKRKTIGLSGFTGSCFLILFIGISQTFFPQRAFPQTPSQEIYREDFEDGQAQGWELEQPWVVDGGMLNGRGHSWAIYNPGNWESARIALRLQTTGVHVDIGYSDKGRYVVSIREENGRLVISLFKQLWPDTFFNNLASQATNFATNSIHFVQMTIGEGRIRVSVNQQQMIDYVDSDPLPPGTIAFETLDNTYAQIDDITLVGTRGSESVKPVPQPQSQPDLTPGRVKWVIDKETRRLLIDGEVRNTGTDRSPPAMVIAGAPGWRGETTVGQISSGGTERIHIALDIREDLQEKRHRLELIVDPDNRIAEVREDNNNYVFEVFIPQIQTVIPGYQPPTWIYLFVAVLLFVLGMLTGRALTFKSRFKWKKRAELRWQLEAETELPEPGEACTWTCKAEASTDLLDRWKIHSLELIPLPVPSGKQAHATRLKGKVLEPLNEAAKLNHLTDDKETGRQRIRPVAEALLEQIMDWKKKGKSPASVKISARLKRDIKCEFKLYHCEETAAGLTWVDSKRKWKGKLHQPAEEFMGVLKGPDARETDFTRRAQGELEGFLLKLIKGVRFKL